MPPAPSSGFRPAVGRRTYFICPVWPFLRLVGRLAAVWLVNGGVNARGADADPFRGVDDKWRHYQSANFELYSRNPETASRDLLHNLELLRAVCVERLKFVERAKVEVTVFYFRTLEDFRAYAPEAYGKNNSFKGYYFGRQDRAVISMAPTDDLDTAQRLIFHEFVHHLFRTAEEEPPVWFNEGMAEFIAGLREDGDKVDLGWPHVGRLRALRTGDKLMPLETLFGVTYQSPVYSSNDHTGLFYAESWALVHYWYCGETKFPPDAVERFLRVAGDQKRAHAADLPALFRECFGIDYAEMQRRLERYVQSGSFRYFRQPKPKIDSEATYAMRPVPREEIQVRLAELALRVNRAPRAKLALLEATEKNPTDPRPFEMLGMEALLEGDQNGARERWEQAVTAGTHNVAIYRELGLLESRAWFNQFDYYFRLPVETTERLRSRLMRSIEYSPQQSAAYEMLAWVEAFAEEPSFANVNLVQQQFPGLRQQQRTLLALAFVRVRFNKAEEAKALLDQLDKMEPDPWTAHGAEIVRAKLEGRPPKRNPAAAPKGKLPVRPPSLKVPSIELPK
jgi:hypothetical protein